MNNLISPNSVSQDDEKPHTAELDDTAKPHVKIKITEIPHEKKEKKAQYRNTVNPQILVLGTVCREPHEASETNYWNEHLLKCPFHGYFYEINIVCPFPKKSVLIRTDQAD